MGRRRLPVIMLSGVTATAVLIGGVAPAYASEGPAPVDPAQLASAAQASADAADLAFTDARWDDVLTHADAFDSSFGSLVALRDRAAADLADLENGDLARALEEYEAAEDLHREKQIARNKAKKAADEADALVRPAQIERNRAVSALNDAKAEVTRLDELLVAAQETVDAAAIAEGADAQAFAEASAEYDGSIANTSAVAAWLRDLGVSVPTYRELLTDRDAAAAEAPGLRSAATEARADREAAQSAASAAAAQALAYSPKLEMCGFLPCYPFKRTEGYQNALDEAGRTASARDAAWASWFTANAAADRAERRVEGYTWIANSVGAEGIRHAFEAAQGAHAASASALSDAEGVLEGLQSDLATAQAAVTDATDVRDAKAAAFKAAKQEAARLAELQSQAQQALFAVKPDRDHKKAVYEALLAQQGSDTAALEALEALVAGLATAQQSVADRRADLVDLSEVRSQVVWSALDGPARVQEGSEVEFGFTIPGPSRYALLDAGVTVVTPEGVAPSCDIPADGIVVAGSTVTCTVRYTITKSDLLTGEVTINVKLSGYLPLGPGNPRSTAATRTLIETEHSVTVGVDAATILPAAPTEESPLVAAPVDAEVTSADLAETGADLGLVGPAALLVMVGAFLVFATRREHS